MKRILRGLLALTALVIGVFGVPAALIALGGNPLPDRFSWAAVARALLQPDDGTVLIGLITLVGWLGWAVFGLSVLAEAVVAVSGFRLHVRLPGLRAPQRLASSLIIAVFALTSPPHPTHAEPASPPSLTASPPRAPEANPSPRAIPAPAPRPTTDRAAAPRATVQHRAVLAPHSHPDGVIHEVKLGDDLWSLAEHYYGAGREWHAIAAANPHVLTGGPDRLEPGWRLAIPGVRASVFDPETTTVVVRRGDTLSSIADRVLGDASHWRELFHANRAVLGNPDELAVGVRLTIPGQSGQNADSVSHKDTSKGDHEPGATTRHEPSDDQPPAVRHEDPSTPPISPTPAPAQPGPQPPAEQAETLDVPAVIGLASVGGLLAAGLVAGLAARRRVQLQARPLGRRIMHPPAADQAVEAALSVRQRPMSLRTLDLALRAISAHCLQFGAGLPALALATVAEDRLELTMSQPAADTPIGFVVQGRSWVVDSSATTYLKTVPGIGEAVRPYPALVTLGHAADGRLVLGDLETMGLLALDAPPHQAAATLAAMAVELSFSPWADEMILTLVGSCPGLPEALGKHNVTRADDLDAVLDRLEARARVQRANRPEGPAGRHRIDPDLADPWAPEIVLVNQAVSADQQRRLADLLTSEPRPTMAAVVTGQVSGATWSLTSDARAEDPTAELKPGGMRLTPQGIDQPAERALVSVVAATGSEVTTAAPWWHSPDPPPDNVTYLGKRFGGWGTDHNDLEGDGTMDEQRMVTDRGHHHPVLKILGPVELVGATGEPPPRASKRCLEYCGWLLEHPGTTAQAMASALIIAEGTRRSNMSRLRTWLGTSAEGEPYLPDAYTGRIVLHPAVSSDWQRLQILTATGVNRTSDNGLHAALELVRGAPLADAAPGEWHWAEELRTDMISAVRDIGFELANRALVLADIDLARWAAARALVAAPGDERLMTVRIRTERLAGNHAEAERLTLQLAAHARALGVDLDPETVELLQEVMEGRVRARLA